MVHHKDKKAAADFLDTAAGCMAVDKEDVVLASADFVAGGDCADFAKTVHTAAHFHMAAVPDMVNDMYDLLVAAVADTAQLFADAAHFEKIFLVFLYRFLLLYRICRNCLWCSLFIFCLCRSLLCFLLFFIFI